MSAMWASSALLPYMRRRTLVRCLSGTAVRAAQAAGAGEVPRVLVTRRLPDSSHAKLAAAEASGRVRLDVWPHEDVVIPSDELLARAEGCAGILCMLSDPVTAEVMDKAGDNLRVVSTMSVGYNHIDIDAARARNLRVGYTPGYLSRTTAELAVGLMMASARRLVETAGYVPSGEWGPWSPLQYCGTDITGSTVGLVGLGAIAQDVARLLSGFGCRILYAAPRPKDEAAAEVGATRVELDELLAASDFVSVHCPLTPETANLFSTDAFKRMKPTAHLINTSRGDTVDQDALLVALQTGEIAAADHPLVGLPNCTIVPHIGSATVKTRLAMANAAVENVLRGVAGDELLHDVLA